jgi:hypothetical protein
MNPAGWHKQPGVPGMCGCSDRLAPSDAGAVAALFILTRFNTQRFEFIFTSLNENAQQLQSVVTSVQAAYNDSLLFRELRLRGGGPRREAGLWAATTGGAAWRLFMWWAVACSWWRTVQGCVQRVAAPSVCLRSLRSQQHTMNTHCTAKAPAAAQHVLHHATAPGAAPYVCILPLSAPPCVWLPAGAVLTNGELKLLSSAEQAFSKVTPSPSTPAHARPTTLSQHMQTTSAHHVVLFKQHHVLYQLFRVMFPLALCARCHADMPPTPRPHLHTPTMTPPFPRCHHHPTWLTGQRGVEPVQ